MLSILFQSPLAFIIILLGLLLAISIHEFAHAWTATKLGDPTPQIQGRVTLNPKAHLDPLGTAMLVLFGFGWGKPVIFDPYNLRNPRQESGIISIAGPISNIILATILGLATKFLFPIWLNSYIYPLIYINLVLAIFNLVPVYPLDGEKILLSLLPPKLSVEFQAIMRRYGILILILLILPVSNSSPITALISPLIKFFFRLIT